MQVIGVATDRRAPADSSSPDDERAMLYDTMFAYGGTFSVADNKVIHHVDVSWNETWTGTDQVRAFEISQNILTITSSIPDPVSGVESHYTIEWEKVPARR
jgi:Lipocalin-like domain